MLQKGHLVCLKTLPFHNTTPYMTIVREVENPYGDDHAYVECIWLRDDKPIRDIFPIFALHRVIPPKLIEHYNYLLGVDEMTRKGLLKLPDKKKNKRTRRVDTFFGSIELPYEGSDAEHTQEDGQKNSGDGADTSSEKHTGSNYAEEFALLCNFAYGEDYHFIEKP